MWLLLPLLIGSITGVLVGTRLLKNFDLLAFNIIAGIVGAIIGLAFSFILQPDEAASSGIDLRAVVCEFIGALIAVWLFGFIHRLTVKHTDTHESFETDTSD